MVEDAISFAICEDNGFVGEMRMTFEAGNWFKREIKVRIASFVFPVPVGRQASVLPVKEAWWMFF